MEVAQKNTQLSKTGESGLDGPAGGGEGLKCLCLVKGEKSRKGRSVVEVKDIEYVLLVTSVCRMK